jgi:hypothetical protein
MGWRPRAPAGHRRHEFWKLRVWRAGIQQEAMLLPGLKLVEKGEIRQDIWRMRFMTGQALVVDGGASHF